MLEQGERTLIVTFPSAADAMLMEKLCRQHGLPGRLIPLPPQISAGCGMCWSAPVGSRAQIEDLLHTSPVRAEGIQECRI